MSVHDMLLMSQSMGKLLSFLMGMRVIQTSKMQDIKDATHQRRSHGSGPIVALTNQTIITLKKKDFLSNKVNKQNFLSS